MDKELSGGQSGDSKDGGNNTTSGKSYVDLDAMLQQSSGGPPLPGAASQNAPVSQPAAAPNRSANQKVKGWMPQIADDTDLIEKEWVEKAKEIVEHTASDPYAQNEQLSELKADYLKKRYNKVIKPSNT